MRLPEVAIGILGLNALGLALTVHPEQAPGIYVGDPRDEHGLNHKRIGDIGALSRIMRGAKIPSLEGRGTSTLDDTPTRVNARANDPTTTPTASFGEHYHCWEGGSLEAGAVLNLRGELGKQCHDNGQTWVKPYSVVYATDREFAVFFCNYGKYYNGCNQEEVIRSGHRLDLHCRSAPGEDYTRVKEGSNWSYGVTFANRHFCTGEEGGYLTQQQGQIF